MTGAAFRAYVEQFLDALWSTIGPSSRPSPRTKCANYLNHCGYGAT
jgi:hypothetical protein